MIPYNKYLASTKAPTNSTSATKIVSASIIPMSRIPTTNTANPRLTSSNKGNYNFLNIWANYDFLVYT